MKTFILIMIIAVTWFGIGILTSQYFRGKLGCLPKAYTVRIINGSPNMSYEAKLQVDSFKIFSPKCAWVYADGNFLKINAEMITISKN